MKLLSLFAGIEGFGLAAHWMGWQTVAAVEWEQFPQMVINKHFKEVEIYGDIKKFDGTKYRGTIDIICGGFPCQPFSVAGNKKGTSDDRYLWPEMYRIIREVAPRWVVAENVGGLVMWNNGMVLDTVLTDLENEGYTTLPPAILPAVAKNAPHRRDRVWIVAYNNSARLQATWTKQQTTGNTGNGTQGIVANTQYNGCNGTENRQSDIKGNDSNQTGTNTIKQPSGCSCEGNVTDPTGTGLQKRKQTNRQPNSQKNRTRLDNRLKRLSKLRNAAHSVNSVNSGLQRDEFGRTPGKRDRSQTHGSTAKLFKVSTWDDFPTQSPVCNGDDGLSPRLVRYLLRSGGDVYTRETAEKEAKRIINKVRKEAIKAGGNAVVPPLVYELFKIIDQIDSQL